MSDILVNTNSLSKSINGYKIIDNINLIIRKKEIHGFIGPNGAGKTTTLRCLLGLLKPDTGFCKIFNEDSYYLSKHSKSKIGVVMDDGGIYDNLTAQDNLIFFGSMYGLSKNEVLESVEKYDSYFDLKDHLNKKVKEFSKGMKQKLRILKEIIHSPEIIFLDEPFSGLDPNAKIELRNLLLLLKEQVSFFIISHDLDEVEKLCDTITIIKGGSIKKTGKLDSITIGPQKVFIVKMNVDTNTINKINKLYGIDILDHDNMSIKISLNQESLNLPRILYDNNIEFEEIYRYKESLENFFKDGEIICTKI